MSPTTAALWAADPLPPKAPDSMYFLALSQAPPALAMNIASKTPETRTPANSPPSSSLSRNPATTGIITAPTPGKIICFRAAFVLISMHFLKSASALPSISPGISLNCRRTSLIISKAACPTAFNKNEENKYGIIPPIISPAITFGSDILISFIPAVVLKALKSANAVRAADPIAKPFPMAAVVFPTASNLSVLFRTSSPSPLISVMPPALSAIGP